MDRHRARCAVLAVAGLSCALLAGVAHAQDDRRGAAVEHRRGVQAFAEGRYQEAIEAFRKADALRPSPAISFNVARAYERMGDSRAAIQEYREYLRRAPRARDAQRVQRRLQELEQQVQQERLDEQQRREQRQREVDRAEEQRLAREMQREEQRRLAELAARRRSQQLIVRSTPAGASVSIDGKALGSTPYAGALPPGPHTLELRLDGFDAAVQRFELSPDAQKEIAIVMSAEREAVAQAPAEAEPEPEAKKAKPVSVIPAAAPLPAATSDDDPLAGTDYALQDEGGGDGIGTAGVLGWIAVGSAAAALGGALTFELLRQAEEERARRAVTQIGFHERMETMETQQTAARVLLGVGGGLAMLGTVLLIAEASRDSRASEHEGLSAELMIGPRSTGARLWARF